jgi:hypothetical protein
MRWWAEQIPVDAGALVVENSAVHPDLQSFAARLVAPTLVVWTTLRPDHEEAWGPGREGAARALLRGVPRGVSVAGGVELSVSPLPELLRANGNVLHALPHSPLSHDAENLALAQLSLELCGVSPPLLDDAAAAMRALPHDLADFRVVRDGRDELAVAFSANDAESTARLFAETGWSPEETTLLYHHRFDRRARLESFLPWINAHSWREKIFTRPKRPLLSLRDAINWNDAINSAAAFKAWWRGRVFACGNVAGWPLEFLLQLTRGAPNTKFKGIFSSGNVPNSKTSDSS